MQAVRHGAGFPFPRIKGAAKRMEMASIPTVMDASRTTPSYGHLSVLLAVITPLWRVALSGAEIAKAHRVRALPATHNTGRALSRRAMAISG